MPIAGKVWTFEDDINTDLIMPQVVFLLPLEEQVKHVFRANRPGWVDQVKEGDFIVAGRNFGTGQVLQGEKLPDFLLNIIRAGGIIPMLKQQGYME